MIERRILLTTMAAVIATPVLAQTTSNKETADDRRGMSGGAAMGAAEEKHIMDTLAAGSMSLLASRVAVKKARDEDVKEFAQFEVAEQDTIADVLMAMKDPSKADGKVNAPSDAEAMKHVSDQDQAMLKKMEDMQPGEAFDTAYVKAQTEGHQKLLRIQEDYLASGRNPAALGVAKLARGQIKEHLTLLADLREEDKGAPTTGRSAK